MEFKVLKKANEKKAISKNLLEFCPLKKNGLFGAVTGYTRGEDILGICELKWTGMGEFNSDNIISTIVGRNPLEEME